MGNCLDRQRPERRNRVQHLLTKFFKLLGIIHRRRKMYEITNRIGHVSANFREQNIIIWGGYCREDHHWYYSSDKYILYDGLLESSESHDAQGDIPPITSGATGAIIDDDFFIFGGFVSAAQATNTNTIYCLNLVRKKWTKIEPELINGPNFLETDKMCSWTSNGKVFVFGGYGNPPNANIRLPRTTFFILDEENFVRGWNNQLIMFDPKTNQLSWPNVTGDVPCPRAACASACDIRTGKVYLFGGRFKNMRMNDLYVGNLSSNGREFVWRMISNNTNDCDTKPKGRSWHSMTFINNDKLLIYGGFSESDEPLNDCWCLDLCCYSWTRMKHFEGEPRLWHTAHYIKDASSVYLIGGCTKNIFSDNMEGDIWHPETIGKLKVQPLTLKQISIDFVAQNHSKYNSELSELPAFLQEQIHSRHLYPPSSIVM